MWMPSLTLTPLNSEAATLTDLHIVILLFIEELSRTPFSHEDCNMTVEMTSLPPISTLASLPRTTRESILSLLFEPSPALHTACAPVLASTTFLSYGDMICAVGEELRKLEQSNDLNTLDEILASHPRLGEKEVDSALSRAEQAAMAKASAGGEDAAKEQVTLKTLNTEYEKAFPGLRYV